MKKLAVILIPVLAIALSACEQPATGKSATAKPAADTAGAMKTDNKNYMAHFETEGNFEEVRDYIKFAITDRGIKINNVSHIGDMLERTKAAVGASETVFTHAEAIEFCSSTISRATMEADPHNIVFCPYIIAIYTLPGEENKVHVSYRHPLIVGTDESKAALQAVEDLMAGIVKDAIQ